MRVLLVTGYPLRGHGGVKRETFCLAQSLAKQGIQVGLMCDVAPIFEGLHHFPITHPAHERIGEKLKSVESIFKPDVIHVVGAGVRMLWHINKSELSTPWLLTVHCVPPFEQGFGYFSGHNAPYYAARNTAGIPSNLAWRLFLSDAEFTYAVCHSEIVATQVTTSGCPSGKIVNIPLGGDFESAVEATTTGSEPFPAGAYPRILSIGGLIHHKGFHDFLPAASSLLRDWPRLHYSVLGETRGWPKYQKYLLEAVERTGMKDHFSLLLNASEAQRQQALESADLYVQPSHEEGFCIAFLEAAAVVPRVIGTRTGAIESAGRDSFGVRVVNVRSPHELEAASRELLGLSVTASDISKRREALTDRFSWEIHGQLHKELYETVARAA